MSVYLALNVVFIIFSVAYIKIEPRIKSDDRKYVMWFLIIIFSVLMAARPLDSPDTAGYVENFYCIEPGQRYPINLLQKYMGYEYGYVYLISFFRVFSNSFRLFFFLTAFAGTSMTVFGLKHLGDKILAKESRVFAPVFAIYISGFGLLYNGISVRAGLSMGLGVMAVDFILDRKWMRGVLLLFLAFTIQRFSILFLPIIFAIKFLPKFTRESHVQIWFLGGAIMFTGLAGKVIPYLADMINGVSSKFQISGVSSYLMDVSEGIGIRDTYFWFLYGGLVVFLFYNKNYGKYLNVIMLGSFIIVFMYGVRAISRAYGMFYLFIVPLLSVMYNEDSGSVNMRRERRMKVLAVTGANAMIMLKLCFG